MGWLNTFNSFCRFTIMNMPNGNTILEENIKVLCQNINTNIVLSF